VWRFNHSVVICLRDSLCVPAWKYKRRFLETGGHEMALDKDYCGEFCM
jgi:hypothetical protein